MQAACVQVDQPVIPGKVAESGLTTKTRGKSGERHDRRHTSISDGLLPMVIHNRGSSQFSGSGRNGWKGGLGFDKYVVLELEVRDPGQEVAEAGQVVHAPDVSPSRRRAARVVGLPDRRSLRLSRVWRPGHSNALRTRGRGLD